ncbi:translocation/assembly module TamB domain-containing protein [Acidovorax radicis]|nr:translocation/assembly module TamB domain-containing protein [Acidovorax radicis]UCV00124.1 translocation/assembly module TamB domain-containing protein [Acidovorax radicis]
MRGKFSKPRVAGADFSAGSSSAPRPPPRRAPRAVRALGWLLLVLVGLLLVTGSAAWWWAGSHSSLATALTRAAPFLPVDQQLESREVSGSLRSGGRIGWLRWSSPSMAVEITDIRLGWQLAPLLQRRLELGEVHAARVQITAQPTPDATPPAPLTPPTQLVLPLQIGVPFRVDEIEWAGPPAVLAHGLAGAYRFDGAQHRLTVDSVELAQGVYSAHATLQAQAPMALDAAMDGTVHTTVPGSGTVIELGARATVQGTLATAAAQLVAQAQVSPMVEPLANSPSTLQPPRTPGAAAAAAPGTAKAKTADAAPTEPMQASMQATLAPWVPQPLVSATATLHAVNLAALWPQAPMTLLQGTVKAGPSPAAATTQPNAPAPAKSPAAAPPPGWAIDADLHNTLPGPWDEGRLPVSALQAHASYDGTRWSVPDATLQAGTGSATVQGHYTPATGALEGDARLNALRPGSLHTALGAAPLSGGISARMQGDVLRFNADVRAQPHTHAKASATKGHTSTRASAATGAATSAAAARSTPTPRTAALRIDKFTAQGSWQAAPTAAGEKNGGTVQLDHLLLDALEARVEATALRIALGAQSVQSAQGQWVVAVPGATARADGQMAPRSGAGNLQLQLSDTARAQRWLAALPGIGSPLQNALRGAGATGAAQLTARWKGGWQTLADQLDAARAGRTLPAGKDTFELQATVNAPRLSVTLPPSTKGTATGGPSTQSTEATQAIELRGVTAELAGSLAKATLALRAEARQPPPLDQRASVQARLSGGLATTGQWQAQIDELRLQVQDAQRPGPWALQLAEPVTITTGAPASNHAAKTPGPLTWQASAGQARLTGPLPGTVTLRWQPAQLVVGGNALPQLQTQGTLQGLPMAWVNALGLGETGAAAGRPAQPLLERMGLATTLVLDGQWDINTTTPTAPRASATLRRAGGDLNILAGDMTAVTAVQSSGQGTGAGAMTVIATEASPKGATAADATKATAANATGNTTAAASSSTANTRPASSASAPPPPTATARGTPAGVRQAELSVQLEGDNLRARLVWASERAGDIDASVTTRIAIATAARRSQAGAGAQATHPTATTPPAVTWAADAPLAGTLRARLPDVGVWSALAPPGWRVRGTLDASATLSGTRNAPQWAGTLGADDMAVRSVVDGVDLQGGRLRATLRGNQLDITEFSLQGGHGSSARIAGYSGNRTAASQDGGTLTGKGRITWGATSEAPPAASGMSGITMALQAEARTLQVMVRADRQVSVSGQLQAQLQQGQISLRGKLTTDRATIILPDESAPSLGSDVVVRSAAKDRADQAKAQAAAKANQAASQVEAAKPPDIAITVNLGNDFALHGHGITTRLTGEVNISSNAVPGAPPRVTGEVRTDQGRYRAWGQMLDVETGLIRFNGPYNNPSLDILALRPNISVRAGVQVTGSAQAPRVKLYADPDLPDAEKLSWVVLGRSAAGGGAEAAVLQQAALALLGRKGGSGTANLASRVGLDEVGVKGPGAGEDAMAAALTFGKRLSKDLYITYERSLSGTLGTLYIFYDLSRRLTLRGQTGEKSAVDIIYTVKYD